MTADLAELSPGEGSSGVKIDGVLHYNSWDYYKIVVSEYGLLTARMEVNDGLNYEFKLYKGTPYVVLGDRTEHEPYVLRGVADPGEYFVRVQSGSGSDRPYTLTIALTTPQTPAWDNLPHDLAVSRAVLQVDLEADDPADAFWLPWEPGDTADTLFDSSDSYYGWNFDTPGGPEQRLFALISQPDADLPTSVDLVLTVDTNEDLSEPNDTPAEAIDVTAYLEDAPADGPFADKILRITGNKSDGTDDWFKLTLDEAYVIREAI